jgi:hypothetical protein
MVRHQHRSNAQILDGVARLIAHYLTRKTMTFDALTEELGDTVDRNVVGRAIARMKGRKEIVRRGDRYELVARETCP